MKCKTWRCKSACCHNIVFTNHELERFSDKIINSVISREPMFGSDVLAITNPDPMKNKCPFLRADYRCNIYENRPDVCRKFGEIPELKCKFV